jgi:hypothetical protein
MPVQGHPARDLSVNNCVVDCILVANKLAVTSVLEAEVFRIGLVVADIVLAETVTDTSGAPIENFVSATEPLIGDGTTLDPLTLSVPYEEPLAQYSNFNNSWIDMWIVAAGGGSAHVNGAPDETVWVFTSQLTLRQVRVTATRNALGGSPGPGSFRVEGVYDHTGTIVFPGSSTSGDISAPSTSGTALWTFTTPLPVGIPFTVRLTADMAGALDEETRLIVTGVA